MTGVNQSTEVVGACLLSIGHVSSTLSNFGWMRRFGDSTLLLHCLKGFRERTPWPVSVLVEQPCPETVMAAAANAGANVLLASGGHWLRSIGLAAQADGKHRVLLLHGLLGLNLIPASFFNKLMNAHLEMDAHFTFCQDLPSPLYAAVCEKKALELFGGLPDGMLKVRQVRVLDACGLEQAKVPRYIPDASAADLARIEAALSDTDGVLPGESLRILRELLIRDWETESRSVCWPKWSANRAARTILFASNPSAFSGSEQALISTVQSLRSKRWNLHCFVAQEGLFSSRLQAEEATLHCPHRDFALPVVPNFLLCGALLDAVSPEILHCNAFVGVPLLAQARSRGVAVLQWARLARFDGILDHLIAADLITAVSKFVQNQLAREMLNPAKVRVLYDGIDAEYFQPADAGISRTGAGRVGAKGGGVYPSLFGQIRGVQTARCALSRICGGRRRKPAPSSAARWRGTTGRKNDDSRHSGSGFRSWHFGSGSLYRFRS